ETGEVVMVAWMDREALDTTLRTGLTHFWSRSRERLWQKGETSGHVQHVQGVYVDCDADVLLVQVHQEGVACHTGNRTCFFTAINAGPPGATMIERLERIVASRKTGAPAGSYVAGLLARGEGAGPSGSWRRRSSLVARAIASILACSTRPRATA